MESASRNPYVADIYMIALKPPQVRHRRLSAFLPPASSKIFSCPAPMS